jgi:hypothetical protein
VVAPDDEWILTTLFELEISRGYRGFGCGEDYDPDDRCYAAVLANGGGSTGGLRSWWCS